MTSPYPKTTPDEPEREKVSYDVDVIALAQASNMWTETVLNPVKSALHAAEKHAEDARADRETLLAVITHLQSQRDEARAALDAMPNVEYLVSHLAGAVAEAAEARDSLGKVVEALSKLWELADPYEVPDPIAEAVRSALKDAGK